HVRARLLHEDVGHARAYSARGTGSRSRWPRSAHGERRRGRIGAVPVGPGGRHRARCSAMLRAMDTIALAALVLSTGLSLLVVPDIHFGDLMEPTVQAVITTPIVLTALLAFRLAGKPPVWERRLLALFLAVMPTIYLTSLALHGGDRTWLAIELAG